MARGAQGGVLTQPQRVILLALFDLGGLASVHAAMRVLNTILSLKKFPEFWSAVLNQSIASVLQSE